LARVKKPAEFTVQQSTRSPFTLASRGLLSRGAQHFDPKIGYFLCALQ